MISRSPRDAQKELTENCPSNWFFPRQCKRGGVFFLFVSTEILNQDCLGLTRWAISTTNSPEAGPLCPVHPIGKGMGSLAKFFDLLPQPVRLFYSLTGWHLTHSVFALSLSLHIVQGACCVLYIHDIYSLDREDEYF